MLKIKCLKDLIVWQTKIWCVCLNLFLAAMAALYLPFVSDGVFGISRHGNNMCYVSLWSLDCETQIISEPPGLQQKKGCDIRVVKCTLAMFPVVPGTFFILKKAGTLWKRIEGYFSIEEAETGSMASFLPLIVCFCWMLDLSINPKRWIPCFQKWTKKSKAYLEFMTRMWARLFTNEFSSHF